MAGSLKPTMRIRTKRVPLCRCSIATKFLNSILTDGVLPSADFKRDPHGQYHRFRNAIHVDGDRRGLGGNRTGDDVGARLRLSNRCAASP
jgi:hypothetical protein